MRQGFFPGSTLAKSKEPVSLVAPKCGSCGLHRKCKSPKMEPSGDFRKGIYVLSSYPGKEEDKKNTQLVGNAGREAQMVFKRAGLNLRKDCLLDNALICYPTTKITDKHIDYCRPTTIKTIEEHKPEVIVLMGLEAVQCVIGWLWKENPGAIGRWAGFVIPSQKLNAWIVPTFNPAFTVREADGGDRRQANPMPRLLFQQHLEKARELVATRPWDTVPDYGSAVERILDTSRAAKILRKMVSKGGTVAIDYECNMLKPEGPGARIYSCAVCWNGKRTIAYPWEGEAIEATRELWRSPLAKIAANLKYEDRWTKHHLGTRTRNWYFDTMVGGHAIDSRDYTKSLKFQAFVYLGESNYNDHIDRFLRADSSMKKNRIHEIEINDLLQYNGLDAVLEYHLARKQMEILGYPFPEGMK